MVGLCFSTEAAVIQILFWSYLLPPLECVWHVRTMTPAPAIWYTGKTKAWRERAQLPLLNYFIQNKSHPTGCLEEKTTLSTLAVALDKWCVSKITSRCGARGDLEHRCHQHTVPTGRPRCRNGQKFSLTLGTKGLHCMAVCPERGSLSGTVVWGETCTQLKAAKTRMETWKRGRGPDANQLQTPCLWDRQGQNTAWAF